MKLLFSLAFLIFSIVVTFQACSPHDMPGFDKYPQMVADKIIMRQNPDDTFTKCNFTTPDNVFNFGTKDSLIIEFCVFDTSYFRGVVYKGPYADTISLSLNNKFRKKIVSYVIYFKKNGNWYFNQDKDNFSKLYLDDRLFAGAFCCIFYKNEIVGTYNYCLTVCDY